MRMRLFVQRGSDEESKKKIKKRDKGKDTEKRIKKDGEEWR